MLLLKTVGRKGTTISVNFKKKNKRKVNSKLFAPTVQETKKMPPAKAVQQQNRSGGFPNPPAVSIRICNLIVSAHHRCLYSPQPDSCVPSVASDHGRATNPAERVLSFK